MTTPVLVRNIIAAADSREAVVQRVLGLHQPAPHYICISRAKSWQIRPVSHRNPEASTKWDGNAVGVQLVEVGGGQGLCQQFESARWQFKARKVFDKRTAGVGEVAAQNVADPSHLINVLVLYGYDVFHIGDNLITMVQHVPRRHLQSLK